MTQRMTPAGLIEWWWNMFLSQDDVRISSAFVGIIQHLFVSSYDFQWHKLQCSDFVSIILFRDVTVNINDEFGHFFLIKLTRFTGLKHWMYFHCHVNQIQIHHILTKKWKNITCMFTTWSFLFILLLPYSNWYSSFPLLIASHVWQKLIQPQMSMSSIKILSLPSPVVFCLYVFLCVSEWVCFIII